MTSIYDIKIDSLQGKPINLADYKNKFFLRAGYKNMQKVLNDDGEEVLSVFPTVGAGFVVKSFSVDYALSNVGDFSQVLYSHVFSLKFNFNTLK